ncbi:MAG: CopD family protein, partial [Actinomycetota bacterium]|nr:CopD family protein [Actinomycetota bacterium]
MTTSASSRVAPPPHPQRRGAADVAAARPAWLLAAPPVAVLVLIVALVLGGGAPEPPVSGLPDPGALTAWGLPVARLAFDLCAVGVLGTLVVTLLLPAEGWAASAAQTLRTARWFASAWACSAVAVVLLTVSDVLGVPLGAVLGSEGLLGYVWQLSQSRSLLLALACGVLVAGYSRWTVSREGVAVLVAVAVAGLMPVLFAGHSAASSDHDLASSSLVVHVLGASVWVGGLFGVLLLRRRPQVLALVLPRYSAVALACFAAVAASGLINAWVRASSDLTAWVASGYAALLAVKLVALAALGVAGWWHRRRTLLAVSAGRPRAFARLATVEALVMAATVAVAVALARTPPPAGAEVDIPSHGLGHPTLGSDVEPFGVGRLLTEWRLDAITLTVLAVAFGCYLAGWRRVRRAAAAGGVGGG